MRRDFDTASLDYDVNFTFSKIGRAQRKMVYRYINHIFKSNEILSILELNCGTGEDAINFANRGHKVLATDASKGMIHRANAKTDHPNLFFKVMDINNLEQIQAKEKYDLIFSNFGGFNCLSTEEIKIFFNASSRLLKKGGKIILVIMSKHCLWERIYFSFKGKFKEAKRRNTDGSLDVKVGQALIKTWYYNPNSIINLSKNEYIKEHIRPVGLAIPPSYLEHSFLTKPLFMNIFKGIDYLFTQPFWSKYADHFLIELTKKP